MTRKNAVVLSSGIVCLSLGIIIAVSWDDAVHSYISGQMVLSKSNKVYDAWVRNKVPIYMRVYFFNWTNPSDMKEPRYKPVLKEIGPYTFSETIEKTDMVWNDNGTVTYQMRHWFHFMPELSTGQLEDLITSANVVAQSAAFVTRFSYQVTKMALNMAMKSTQKIYVTKTVREHLFDGYSNPLLQAAKTFPMFSSVTVKYNRFAWYYRRNGTTDWDGVSNVDTGTNSIYNAGKIRSWNYQNQTNFFRGKCGAVQGYTGPFFPPKTKRTDNLQMYSPDLCRYVTMNYIKDEEVSGIPGYRFESPLSMFDNGASDPENKCNCDSECAPPGALNVSACRYGTPGFVSYPHFLGADKSYHDAVIGMEPDEVKHKAHLVLEPTYGLPLDVVGRFQINMLVQPYKHLSLYDGVPKIYFPVLWLEQSARITDSETIIVKVLLALPLLGTILSAVLVTAGVGLIIGAIAVRFIPKKRKLPNEGNSAVLEPMIKPGGKKPSIWAHKQ